MIRLLLLKLAIFIILSLVLIKIAKVSTRSKRILKLQVQRTLQEDGWTCLAHTYYGKSWIAVYKKFFQKQVVLVNENLLTFDDLRKAVIIALLSNANEIGVYYYQITPHAKKALHLLSKSRKHHGIKLFTQEPVKC
ncbi:MAG: hypothetical protein ACK40Q_00740 [Pseudothermotoga sp.]